MYYSFRGKICESNSPVGNTAFIRNETFFYVQFLAEMFP